MKKVAYPHQLEALNKLRYSLSTGHKHPLLEAPTGSGKTILGALAVESALKKGKRVMFTVPAISLVNQTAEKFFEQGIEDIGIIQANHPATDYSKPVQICSIQSLSRMALKNIPHADVVFVDEAHRLFEFYSEWMGRWDNIPFIGLSATPWTKGLGKHYDDLIQTRTLRQLIGEGYLCDFEVWIPDHPDMSKVRTSGDDWNLEDLAAELGKNPHVANVVDNWLKNGRGLPTVCFAVNCAHAKKLFNEFLAKGVSAAYIDAFTKIEERELIAEFFHAGKIQVVVNVGCLTTGIDWDIRCIILDRGTKSEMLYVQILGRGLRTAPGKGKLLIFDHTDTTLRLGFITDIHHDHLDMGEKKPSKASEPEKRLPKDCPSCGYCKPVGVHACPHCGFAPEKQSPIESTKGRLKKLTAAELRNKNMTVAEKADFYGQLLYYATMKGKGEKWVLAKFRAFVGVWPNLPEIRNAKPVVISQKTIKWITASNIRYAKRRAA